MDRCDRGHATRFCPLCESYEDERNIPDDCDHDWTDIGTDTLLDWRGAEILICERCSDWNYWDARDGEDAAYALHRERQWELETHR